MGGEQPAPSLDGVCEEPQEGPRTPAQPEAPWGGQGVPLTSTPVAFSQRE